MTNRNIETTDLPRHKRTQSGSQKVLTARTVTVKRTTEGKLGLAVAEDGSGLHVVVQSTHPEILVGDAITLVDNQPITGKFIDVLPAEQQEFVFTVSRTASSQAVAQKELGAARKVTVKRTAEGKLGLAVAEWYGYSGYNVVVQSTHPEILVGDAITLVDNQPVLGKFVDALPAEQQQFVFTVCRSASSQAVAQQAMSIQKTQCQAAVRIQANCKGAAVRRQSGGQLRVQALKNKVKVLEEQGSPNRINISKQQLWLESQM